MSKTKYVNMENEGLNPRIHCEYQSIEDKEHTEMAELADATDSKPVVLTDVRVQVPLSVPQNE